MPAHDSALPSWPSVAEEAAVLADLTRTLASQDGPADETGTWPTAIWQTLVDAEATRWALPSRFGGAAADRSQLLARYAAVAEGSMTAAFILTQHDAAIRRLALAAEGPGKPRAESWLDQIASGAIFPTVGISQLTTSRRHGARAMAATETPDGFVLDGAMPWVTAAEHAQVFVTGGVLEDGRQLLAAVPRDAPGLTVLPAFDLAALGSSRTSEVACEGVRIAREDVLAGPSLDVMAIPGLAGTGGLETSALALGQSRSALVALHDLAENGRDDLQEPATSLAETWRLVANDLRMSAEGRAEAPAPSHLRGAANDLALRSTQAFLTARKGTGFLRSEPAQRWARQALFFLVWSCPSPVANAAIRDLAGLCEV